MNEKAHRLASPKRQAKETRVVATQVNSLVGSKRKVPLHIVMRDFTLQQRINALVASVLHEADGTVGDILVPLIDTVRWLSFRLDDRRHRINAAWELSYIAADLRRSTFEIVHSTPRENITVTKYPTAEDEVMRL